VQKLLPSRAMSGAMKVFGAKAPQMFIHVQNIGRGHHTLSHGPTIFILNFLHMGFPHFRRLFNMIKRHVRFWIAASDRYINSWRSLKNLPGCLSMHNKNPYRLFLPDKIVMTVRNWKLSMCFCLASLDWSTRSNQTFRCETLFYWFSWSPPKAEITNQWCHCNIIDGDSQVRSSIWVRTSIAGPYATR
jgi:hypothetical protein